MYGGLNLWASDAVSSLNQYLVPGRRGQGPGERGEGTRTMLDRFTDTYMMF